MHIAYIKNIMYVYIPGNFIYSNLSDYDIRTSNIKIIALI